THLARTRREFLTTSACGIGGIALGSLLARDGVLNAATALDGKRFDALQPHHEPKAKACIFIFMAGAPSHVDLF
ncbi:MAG: twin-arginine translocation signal domain-containing protein, partial [Akkermansiaceae bacterium]|nr:twin-arginine translocation signal domain-containing protein [Akkermansiaceae bacterium]